MAATQSFGATPPKLCQLKVVVVATDCLRFAYIDIFFFFFFLNQEHNSNLTRRLALKSGEMDDNGNLSQSWRGVKRSL